MHAQQHSFEVSLYLADERGDHTYLTEHRLLTRPDADTVRALLDEARRDFAVVYGGEVRAEDLGVRVTYRDGEDEDC